MLKVMLYTLLVVFFMLTGCEKDEIVPVAEPAKEVSHSALDISSADREQQSSKATEGPTKSTDSDKVVADEQEKQNSSQTESKSTTSSEEKAPNKNVSTDKVNSGTENEEKSTTNKTNTTNSSANKAAIKTEEKDTNHTPPATQEKQTNSTAKPNTESKAKENEQPTKTTPPPKKEVQANTVTVTVVGDQQVGTILPTTKVELKDGNTVLDVTLTILKQKGVPVSVRGSGTGAYVEGIANLFEFDRGPLSGWLVKRNGTLLDRSSGAVEVKNGDSVQWIYTTDYEKDTN